MVSDVKPYPSGFWLTVFFCGIVELAACFFSQKLGQFVQVRPKYWVIFS
jgi:hypothetical protein